MPHLTLEYSNNLPDKPDFKALFALCHEALTEFDSVRLPELKSRAVPCDQFFIGAGSPQNIFVHLTVAVLDGRPADQRKQMGERLLVILRETFARSWKERPCDITVEIREMNRDTYCKAANFVS